jgi:hypothetical protein
MEQTWHDLRVGGPLKTESVETRSDDTSNFESSHHMYINNLISPSYNQCQFSGWTIEPKRGDLTKQNQLRLDLMIPVILSHLTTRISAIYYRPLAILNQCQFSGWTINQREVIPQNRISPQNGWVICHVYIVILPHEDH